MRMKTNEITLALIFLIALLTSCQGSPNFETPAVDITDRVETNEFQLERKLYRTNLKGQKILNVFPIINSREGLLQYKEYKVNEAKQIMDMTQDRADELPYFSAVLTFKEPLPISEINNLITNFNPTVKSMTKDASLKGKCLLKSDFIKGVDSISIFKAKFKSTMGGGELPFETLSNPEELGELESMIAQKEKELNGIDDYQFIKGITSIYGAVNRDKLDEIQKDPRVFLVDIGPAELYEKAADYVDWRDIYNKVESFYAD